MMMPLTIGFVVDEIVEIPGGAIVTLLRQHQPDDSIRVHVGNLIQAGGLFEPGALIGVCFSRWTLAAAA
jgi:hypothetical protein